MNGLRLRRCDEVAAAPPASAARETWRDRAGGVIAYGWRDSEEHVVLFPGVAEFRFDAGAGPVSARAGRGVSAASIRDTYLRSVLPIVLQVRGECEALHASAVRMAVGIVAFCAVSETGKSTLAGALERQGYPLWADDAVVWNIGGGVAARAVPLPFRSKLREPSRQWLGAANEEFRKAPDEGALQAVFALERAAIARPEAVALPSSRAFAALLRHAYCFSLGDAARKRRMLERYLALAAEVAVFELRFPAGLEHVPATMREVERTLCLDNSGPCALEAVRSVVDPFQRVEAPEPARRRGVRVAL